MEPATFNLKRFDNARFEPRTEEVNVPELKEHFDGEGTPIWTVRGMSGQEFYRVKNSASRDQMISSLISSFAGSTSEKISAVKEIFGVGNEVDAEGARRIEMLTVCSVNPEINREVAVKLFHAFPLSATKLTDAILRLTGDGFSPGKPPGSGENPASATP